MREEPCLIMIEPGRGRRTKINDCEIEGRFELFWVELTLVVPHELVLLHSARFHLGPKTRSEGSFRGDGLGLLALDNVLELLGLSFPQMLSCKMIIQFDVGGQADFGSSVGVDELVDSDGG